MTKPGYKSSEFWLSAAAMLLSLLFASGVLGDGGKDLEIASLVASVLTALGYQVSRTGVKKASAAKPGSELIEDELK